MTSELPSPTGPTRGAVREDLLAAATAELVEHGSGAISLRAVARRAGVSHAAPKHHFGDRAGLLTAVATQGFEALASALRAADVRADEDGADPRQRLASLGTTYVDVGLADPALFDLMFRPSELHPDDPRLVAAQEAAVGVLTAAVQEVSAPPPQTGGPPLQALASWAFVHGLVVLVRDGALGVVTGAPDAEQVRALAHALVDVFVTGGADDRAGGPGSGAGPDAGPEVLGPTT